MTKPIVKQCTCKHAYQDSRYGTGMRVCNAKKAQTNKQQTYTCTVCHKEHVA